MFVRFLPIFKVYLESLFNGCLLTVLLVFQDLIMNLLNSLQFAEVVDGECD